MDKQLLITKTRAVSDRQSLLYLLNEVKADLLGSNAYPFTIRRMLRLCNPNLQEGRYRTFSIPKKSGDIRIIDAPTGNLKWMQICLNEIFKALYTPSRYATGFAEGRNIVDNAKAHTNQNYVFNIDLEDFFTSVRQSWVWRRLQKAPFNFNREVANVMAGLCCIKTWPQVNENGELIEDYCLPQGAPTSPLLTNAICDALDRRLAGLAKRFGLHYSRYADDITFSSMHNVYREGGEFRKELERIITNQNFRINPTKTRLNHRSQRQEVTGLTVSEKVNVSRKYVKDVRAILHIWERYGLNAAISAFYPRYMVEKGYKAKGEPNLENLINGKLCYLKMVKGEGDPVYVKLKAQFDRVAGHSSQGPLTRRMWEYLFTDSITDFEKRFGVEINIEVSKQEKLYAYFMYKGEKIMVAVSKNIAKNPNKNRLQISLCRETDFKLHFGYPYNLAFDDSTHVKRKEAYNRMRLDAPKEGDLAQRYIYLIHHPLRDGQPRKKVLKDPNAEAFKESVIDFMDKISELDWEVTPREILPRKEEKDILSRLVESGFNLEILSDYGSDQP